jgi:hypothetical protein
VYEISVSGLSEGGSLHFDVYNHVAGSTRGIFAPFSHDGEGGKQDDPDLVPEPASIGIWGLGICLAVFARNGFRRRKSA